MNIEIQNTNLDIWKLSLGPKSWRNKRESVMTIELDDWCADFET